MSDDPVAFVLEFDGEPAPGLADEVAKVADGELSLVERHGLEGDLNTWLLIGNFVVSSVATLLPFITALLQSRRPKSIRLGEIVIEDPTPEQVDELLRRGT